MLVIFQFSVTLLVCVTSLVLAGAEESIWPAMTVLVAVISLWFVDRLKLFALSPLAATALSLLAFAVAIAEFNFFRQQSVLGVGGHLLGYLIQIFLLQKKTGRHYLWVFALCQMQIAVASMLTYSIWFGVGLAVYGLLTIWSMSIFLLYRSTRSLPLPELVDRVAGDQPASASTSIGQVWNGVAHGPSTRLISAQFIGNTLFVFVQTLLIGALFFLLIPRVWANSSLLAGLGQSRQALTGFSDEVRLGDLGEILEDDKDLMKVQAFHANTNLPLSREDAELLFGDDPLFRGAVLEVYEGGRWRGRRQEAYAGISFGAREGSIRLQFDVQPISVESIFTFDNVLAVQSENQRQRVMMGVYSNVVRRNQNVDLSQPFTYYQYTDGAPPDTWFSQWRKRYLEPEGNTPPPLHGQFSPEEYERYLRLLTRVPEQCEQLTAVADRVVGTEKDPEKISKRIEEWFTNYGGFKYTSKLTVMDSNLDPIVDFVVNRRKGHCEYFASAMAIMLRTQGIPSRVITGMKGGIWSPRTSVLTVKQLHAHAWVEVYLDGKWVTFDPTPADRDVDVQKMQGLSGGWGILWLDAETAWARLANLSQETQQTRIYQPLYQVALETVETTKSLFEGDSALIHRIRDIVMYPDRWFSWEGGVLAAVVMLFLSGLFWLVRWAYRLYARWENMNSRESDANQRAQRIVPFYERFLAILRKQGLEQGPTQTAREFADMALQKLRSRLVSMNQTDSTTQLVETFYQVRFGGVPLNSIDLTQLEQQLNQLDALLSEKQEEVQ